MSNDCNWRTYTFTWNALRYCCLIEEHIQLNVLNTKWIECEREIERERTRESHTQTHTPTAIEGTMMTNEMGDEFCLPNNKRPCLLSFCHCSLIAHINSISSKNLFSAFQLFGIYSDENTHPDSLSIRQTRQSTTFCINEHLHILRFSCEIENLFSSQYLCLKHTDLLINGSIYIDGSLLVKLS